MEQVLNKKLDPNVFKGLPIIAANKDRTLSEKEEKHLRELVTYEFMNLEEPGLSQTFSYGNAKNKTTFTFFHGGKYRVPRFIGRHVESKSIPIWTWTPDGSGRLEKTRKGSKSRFQMREVYE